MTDKLTRCAVMKDPLAQAVAEATALLKAENLDAWLSLLLARPAARPAMLGVWGVLTESARLPWQLQEPLLCRLRMEFWRAALAGEETPALPAGAAAPPPLLALWPPALPRADMAEALAQLGRLADGAFASDDDVRQWSEAVFAPLFRTLAQAACVSRDGARLENPPDLPAMDAPLRALARAHGTGFLLRRVAWPRRSTPAALLGDEVNIARLVEAAQADFRQARAHGWPRRLLPALWPASLMHHWLRRAARQPGFPQQPAAMPSQLARQWRLLLLRIAGGV